ncbi:MAG: hypothetical protein AAF985_04075 [Bacteroidota bacterium]
MSKWTVDAYLKYPIAAALVALIGVLGFGVEQSDFLEMGLCFTLFFGLFLFVYQGLQKQSTVLFFIALGIVLRLILLFSLPNLSDDIYRFVWDGRLIIHGYNPFDQLPTYYLEKGIVIPGIDQSLFDALNSPEYFTVYPPICQAIFALASWVFPSSLEGATLVMKGIFLCFESGSILLIYKLLQHFQIPLKRVLLYAINPMIILELLGNLHFETAMIFFLLLAFWLLIRDKPWLSAIAMAFAIAAKLLPLMFLPLLIRRLGWAKSFRYFTLLGLCLIVLFFPLLNNVLVSNLGESLGLYFQKFEFNASLYYLARWIGYQLSGYNMIAKFGPALALIVLFGILLMAFREKNLSWPSLAEKMMFGLCLFLFCSTTVMPWYVSTVVALSIFTTWRFPVFWSGLIMLTYINYSYTPYHENLWIVALEYVLLVSFIGKEWNDQKIKYNLSPEG